MESLLLFLLVSVMLTAALSATSYECPSTLSSDNPVKVFGQSCYQFVMNQKKTFKGAENFCQDNHGHLATIKSNDVNNFLSDTLQNMEFGYVFDLWIGLHRTKSDGYIWTDGSTLGRFDKFMGTRLNNFEYNVALRPSLKLWTTFLGGSMSLLIHQVNNFICENPALPITTATTSDAVSIPAITPTTTTTGISSTAPFQHDIRDNKCPSYLRRDKYLQVIDNRCLLFVMDAFVSFNQAERFCTSRGGGLVTGVNVNVNKVKNQLRDIYGLRSFDAWIGLRFFPSEGVHKWLDGKVPVFTNFRSECFNEADRCMAISPIDGKWVAYDCSNTYLPFVCRI